MQSKDNSKVVGGDFEKSAWTVTRKLTLLIVVLTTASFSLFIVSSASFLKRSLFDMATLNYSAMTEQFADSAQGAYRWGKPKQAEALFVKSATGDNNALFAMSLQGAPESKKPISAVFSLEGQSDNEIFDHPVLVQKEVVDSTQSVEVGDYLLITVPVRVKVDSPVIGNLTTVWDMSGIHASVEKDTRLFYILGALAVGVLALLLGLVISKGVGKRITNGVEIAMDIAKGNLDSEIKIKSHDELGQLAHALKAVQESLKAGDDSQRRAAEFGRIKQALDCASVNTLLVDADYNCAYVNEACLELLNNNPSMLHSKLGERVSADIMIGKPLEIFAGELDITESAVARVKNRQFKEVTHAGQTLLINITPVIDAAGVQLGTVFEFVDRTTEMNAEIEVEAMVDAAANGDFSRRINTDDMQGFYAQVATMLNKLAEISDNELNDTLDVLKNLAAGNLKSRIRGEQRGKFAELGDSCNVTSDKLAEIVAEIRAAGIHISNGANEIARGNADLSSRTEQQTAHVHKTVSAMGEISEIVRNNSDFAHKANKLVAEAKEEAEQGEGVADRAVLAVNKISESSKEIVEIIGVIDEIAFQTNLLALNASVEAARAGDKGRGFAVVASEVRDLAGRSATAAKEIKELINDSVSRVAEGERLVSESGRALNTIVGSVTKVSTIVSEIAAAGIDQTRGINEINSAISQIDGNTQSNAALVDKAAVASVEVDEQAKHLGELVGFFKINADKNPGSQSSNDSRFGSRAA